MSGTNEYQYLSSPESGKLFDLILQLATELHVTRHRQRTLETFLVREGVLTAGAVDAFEASAEEAADLDEARTSYLARLVRVITESGPAEHPLREQWEAALATKLEA